MLAVAKANQPKTDISIDWQQGDMCALPLPDNAFDIVLCHQGLQFVSDKLAALRHMHRVLCPGGRLAFTVWSGPWPWTVAAIDALGRHVNEEAKVDWLSPYSWADAESIREVVDQAGFQSIEMDIIVSTMRWPSSAEEVEDFLEVSATRSQYVREITAARKAIVQEIRAALEPYRENDEVVMSIRSHLVQAQTP